MQCDCFALNPVPGALFPIESDGDPTFPYVERCDECKRFPDDVAAAKAVVASLGGRLCIAYDKGSDRYYKPFVLLDDMEIKWVSAWDRRNGRGR